MEQNRYLQIWIANVDIKAKEAFKFSDLVYSYDDSNWGDIVGAIAIVLLKASSIREAIDYIEVGFDQMNFDINFIERIENLAHLVENGELADEIINDANWLIESNFFFKTTDKLFPYTDD